MSFQTKTDHFQGDFNIVDSYKRGPYIVFQDKKTKDLADMYSKKSATYICDMFEDMGMMPFEKTIIIKKICNLGENYFIQGSEKKFAVPQSKQALLGKLMNTIMSKQMRTGKRFFPVKIKNDIKYKWIYQLLIKAS
jgi:hypothetical protein